MSTLLRLPTIALVGVLLTACSGSATTDADAAATVNGETIERQVVVDAVEELHGFSELSADERAELADRIAVQERETIRLRIVNVILEDLLEERDLEVDEGTVAELRAETVEQAGGEEALMQSVGDLQMAPSTFDEVFLPQQAMISALRSDLVGDEDVEMRQVRHILVADEATAEEAVERIEDGEDFGTVAEELSSDTQSAQQGGELPLAQRGSYVPAFDEATWDAEIGELVGPVETEYGFHVLEVIEEEAVAASELDDQQLSRLVDEELAELVGEAFDDAEVSVDESFGEWDPESRNVVAPEEVGEQPELGDQPES